jgi:hypothetical protein
MTLFGRTPRVAALLIASRGADLGEALRLVQGVGFTRDEILALTAEELEAEVESARATRPDRSRRPVLG